MQIYPAVDLFDGRCVRLSQGRFSEVTVYGDDVVSTVESFAQAGANWLHLIDLNGAQDGAARQHGVVSALAKPDEMSIQVGGGVRTVEDLEGLLSAGASRVIVGSVAVTDPMIVVNWIERFGPERLVVALDVRLVDGEPMLAIQGWQEHTDVSVYALLRQLVPCGLCHALCTDIRRDGLMSGPSLELYAKILDRFPHVKLQASGGVACLDDIIQLREAGLDGVIIGRALYERRFTLQEALAC